MHPPEYFHRNPALKLRQMPFVHHVCDRVSGNSLQDDKVHSDTTGNFRMKVCQTCQLLPHTCPIYNMHRLSDTYPPCPHIQFFPYISQGMEWLQYIYLSENTIHQ